MLNLIKIGLAFCLASLIVGLGIVAGLFWHFSHGLPDHKQLVAVTGGPMEIAGVLTKVSPGGKHHDIDVPFPAGVAVDRWGTVFVSAFSIAPAGGLAGSPPGVNTSGQVWRLRF